MRRVQEAQREPEHGAIVSGRGGREDGDVADAADTGSSLWGYSRRSEGDTEGRTGLVNEPERCDQSNVADAGRERGDGRPDEQGSDCQDPTVRGEEGIHDQRLRGGDVADANSISQQRGRGELSDPQGPEAGRRNHGPWGACEWRTGSDGKAA